MKSERHDLRANTSLIESHNPLEHPYVTGFEVEPYEQVKVSMDLYMGSAEEVDQEIGLEAPLVAGVRVAGQEFAILDTSRTDNVNTPTLIVDERFHADRYPQAGFKGVWPGEEVLIGRDHHTDRFNYSETTSRDHFSVKVDLDSRHVIIRDLGSLNGTRVSGFIARDDIGNKIQSDHTEMGIVFFEHSRRYGKESDTAPYGYYRNMPIIGRDSPTVRGGVYGTFNSEMVLVDDKSNILRSLAGEYISKLQGAGNGTLGVRSILLTANHHAAKTLQYNLEETDRLSRPHYESNGLIDLSEYVENGVGVCRHQALLAALLIDEAIRQGYMNGKVGVERNTDLELNGAHAWAVYKEDFADDVIIDPAQNFVGTRDEAERAGRWKYRLAG